MPEELKAFRLIIQLINQQISLLNSNGYKIYDADNQEFFISRIRYDKEEDKIKFDTEEDK